jgi:hypothetical protein
MKMRAHLDGWLKALDQHTVAEWDQLAEGGLWSQTTGA